MVETSILVLTVRGDYSFMRTLALCLHIETIGLSRSYGRFSRVQQKLYMVQPKLTSRECRDNLAVYPKCLVIHLRLNIVFNCYNQCSELNFHNHTLTLHPQSVFPIQRCLCTIDLPPFMQRTCKDTPLIGRTIPASATPFSRSATSASSRHLDNLPRVLWLVRANDDGLDEITVTCIKSRPYRQSALCRTCRWPWNQSGFEGCDDSIVAWIFSYAKGGAEEVV